MTKNMQCDFVALLAEKEDLLELGHYHVQVLREERDTARNELEVIRKAAACELQD